MSEQGSKPETREDGPAESGIKVFRVRHGETEYKEHLGTLRENEFDLTLKGQEQIRDAALKIAAELNSNDVVYVLASARKRAQHSAAIMRQVLEEKGASVWRNTEGRDVRKFEARITGAAVVNNEGEPVPPHDARHQEFYEQINQEVVALVPEEFEGSGGIIAAWREGAFKNLENWETIARRSRNQLALLQKLARRFARTTNHRIVVVQLEHTETLDELLEAATDGTLGGRQGHEPERGEIIELDIPAEGHTMTVRPLSRGLEPRVIELDHLERVFKKK